MNHPKFTITKKEDYVLVKLRGTISAEDIVAAVKEGLAMSQDDLTIPGLWDISSADLSDIDSNIAMDTAKEIDRIKKDLPVIYLALVSARDINQGMMAFFKTIYNKDVTEIFDNFEEAEDWIKSLRQ